MGVDVERAKARYKKWKSENVEEYRAYQRKYQKEYYLRNPHVREARKAAARKRYWENRDALLAYQKAWRRTAQYRRMKGLPEPAYPPPDLCECCGKLPGQKGMVIDHCHETGKFRGWLCGTCNTGIGMLGDKVDGLIKASIYIAKVMRRNFTCQ